MPYILRPTHGWNLFAALLDSKKATLVYEVQCKKVRKDQDLTKPVLEVPNPAWKSAPKRLPVTLLSEPSGYTGKGTISASGKKVKFYGSAEGTDALAGGAVDYAASTVVYVEGLEAGNVELSLKLTGPRTGGTAKCELKAEEPDYNNVTPKLEMEYKVVLLDRGLAAHVTEEDQKVYAQPTYIQISYTETNPAYPFAKGATLKCTPDNVDLFFDADCKKPVASGKIKPEEMKQDLQVYLKAKTGKKGKFDAELTLDDPADPFVKLKDNPAKENMGVVELEMQIHRQDASALAGVEVDPDTGTIDQYHTALKAKKLPDQKLMTDEQKVKEGRFLHVQSSNNFGRAKLIVKKLDAAQWPDGTDDYLIDIADPSKLKLYDEEFDGAEQAFPVQVTVADLKSKEKVFWIEGTSASAAKNDVRLDAGLDRAEGGLAKTPKRYGDWARFSVVKIGDVKVDYTPEANKPEAWESGKHRFHINFKAGEDGRKVTISAQLTPKIQDVPIHFMLAPHEDNMKAANWGVDMPGTWEWKKFDKVIGRKDKSDRKKVLHLSQNTDDQGLAKKELILSRIGGDRFTPCCYLGEDPHLAKYVPGHADLKKRQGVAASYSIEVWRKFWYQIVKVEGINSPGLDGAVGQYERVKADMAKTTSNLDVTRATVDGYNPKAIYKRYMIEVNGGNADALVVSDTNKGQFFSGYAAEADKPIKIPILICDAQWDPDGLTSAKNVDNLKPTDFPVTVKTDKRTLDPPLQGGSLLSSGTWLAAEWDAAANGGAGDWVNTRNGNLAAGDIEIDSGRDHLNKVQVKLPAGVGATTADTRIWIENLIVNGADDFLGEYSSGTKRILAVYDPTEAQDFQNTIAHELGHAFHQATNDPGVDGIPVHSKHYYKRGDHCKQDTNKCLMYESGPVTGSHNRYCDTCHPYVLIQDMQTLA